MFARTPRLLLRPGFPEDAMALLNAIADESVVRNLATAPWPYSIRDAEAYLAKPRDPVLPSLLIFERGSGAPQLVGACGLGRRPSGSVELGYWIARAFWGRGLATEALYRTH
jgi:RimJ/RimL family protein N-acetyltransferase